MGNFAACRLSWDATPCSLPEVCGLLEELVAPIFRVGEWSVRDRYNSEIGDNTFHRNFGTFLPDFMASNSGKRQPSK
jgi:hypothetical protein